MVPMARSTGLAFLVLGTMACPVLGCGQGGDPANPTDAEVTSPGETGAVDRADPLDDVPPFDLTEGPDFRRGEDSAAALDGTGDPGAAEAWDIPGLPDIAGDPASGDPDATADIPGTDAMTGDEASGGGPALVGRPCTSAESCPPGGSGTTDCRLDWPDGYCAVTGCADHGHDCPGDAVQSKCVLAPTSMCLALCDAVTDCRSGYACVAKPDAAGHGTASVCFPE